MLPARMVLLLLAVLFSMEFVTEAASDEQYPVIVGGRNKTFLQRIFDNILTLPVVARIITEITANVNTIYTFIVNILLTPSILAIEKGQAWNSFTAEKKN
jgi:hypothetical protein